MAKRKFYLRKIKGRRAKIRCKMPEGNKNKKGIDVDKLRRLATQDEKHRYNAARTCADCHDERKFCPLHQKAEAYLSKFFDVGSDEYHRYSEKYIGT